MNKHNKITLPIISPTTQRSGPRSQRKSFKGWPLNDTFSNWKNTPNNPQLHCDNGTSSGYTRSQQYPLRHSSKSQLSSGMTLAEYFRTRTTLNDRGSEETYEVTEEIIPYLKQNFDIHQTDEDQCSESQISANLSKMEQKRTKNQQLLGSVPRITKVKTECDDQNYIPSHHAPYTKKKLSFKNTSNDKLQHLQQSFDMKSKSRVRTMSNEPSKKVKFTEGRKVTQGGKKIAMLERVRADKMRISELKDVSVDLVMKYAAKFKLDEKVCADMKKPQ